MYSKSCIIPILAVRVGPSKKELELLMDTTRILCQMMGSKRPGPGPKVVSVSESIHQSVFDILLGIWKNGWVTAIEEVGMEWYDG